MSSNGQTDEGSKDTGPTVSNTALGGTMNQGRRKSNKWKMILIKMNPWNRKFLFGMETIDMAGFKRGCCSGLERTRSLNKQKRKLRMALYYMHDILFIIII